MAAVAAAAVGAALLAVALGHAAAAAALVAFINADVVPLNLAAVGIHRADAFLAGAAAAAGPRGGLAAGAAGAAVQGTGQAVLASGQVAEAVAAGDQELALAEFAAFSGGGGVSGKGPAQAKYRKFLKKHHRLFDDWQQRVHQI